MIGLARYVVELRHNIRVSKTREAIDELFRHNDIKKSEYDITMKIIGFRNKLVHDYLKIDDQVMSLDARSEYGILFSYCSVIMIV